MSEETATAKKGGIRIAVDWIDGDSDSDDAFGRSSPYRGVPPPSASRKGNGKEDYRARYSHVRGGTRVHIDVCLTSPPSSAPKVKDDVFVDARSSPNHGGDVCFASPPPAAGKATKRRPDAGEGESSGRWNEALRWEVPGMSDGALRREVAGMSDGELRREIAGLRSTLRRFQAEARKRKGNAYPRSSADRGGDVCFASPPPAATKGKRRREAAAVAEGQFFSGMSNVGLRRDIEEMSDGELRREIAGLRNNTHLQFQPSLAERRRRLLPLLEAEARRRQGW